MKPERLPLLLVAALSTASCSRLAGPAYERPTTPVKEDWAAVKPPVEASAVIQPDWWTSFGDPFFSDLVGKALAGNLDLRIAAGRIERARAQAGVAGSRRLPSLGASAGATWGRQDVAGQGERQTESYETGAGLNWELDLWGKLKKGAAAAEAEFQATEADWRSAYLLLISDVAGQYFRLRQIDDASDVYRRFIADSEKIVSIYDARVEMELLAPDTADRQRAELRRLRRDLLDLQRERDTAVNGLAVLLGLPAGRFSAPAGEWKSRPSAVPVPPGVPSDLLERRPDILAAEYRVLAAYNLLGKARLDRLPSISLTGNGGSAAQTLGSLLTEWTIGIGPRISIPLFDPTRRAEVQVREADVKIASDQYRSTVIRAFTEVENSLLNLYNRRNQETTALAALEDLRRARNAVAARFEEGLVSQLEVLEADRSLMQAEQLVLNLRYQVLNDTVNLYKALGGGWPATPPAGALK